MRASVYVDGFNLYNVALKGTPYKWLDLRKLARFLLPNDRIHRIRYFTALIQMPRDQPTAQRQQTYIRALETLPRLSVHYGSCRSDVQWMPRAGGKPGQHELVIETKEKGSDVNWPRCCSRTGSAATTRSPSSSPTIPTWSCRSRS